VAAASWLKYFRLAFLSQPKPERRVYRLVKRHQVTRIVEVGLRSIGQTKALIEVAQRFAPEGKVAYTGVDWFDARPQELSPLTLKQTHTALQATGAQIRLVPGAPGPSIRAIANAHQNTQLILIADSVSDHELESAWFYVPRMLRADSVILRQRMNSVNQPTFVELSVSDLAARVECSAHRRAA
jgi:hypothetical protein